MAISFFTEDIQLNLKRKSDLKNWIKLIAAKNKKLTGDLNFIFTSDELLLKKNIAYLNHKTLTDIITFDYSLDSKISGDLFISIERVKDNAQKFETDFTSELHRVMIHGVLHLCGYKDKTTKDANTMRLKENEALKLRSKNLLDKLS